MEFCFSVGAAFSIQHLTVMHEGVGALRSRELAVDPEFPALIDAMLDAKRRGLPVSGGRLYLQATRDRRLFACTPTAVPHVDHLGRLAYPCRELQDHVKVDLLAAGSLRAALLDGYQHYGPPPVACPRCPDRCYVEMSNLVRNPADLVREAVGYVRQTLRTDRD
jgi:hypothetical protein